MTNENNNINELVSDRNDVPKELEAVTWQESSSQTWQDAGTESDARTFDITKFVDLDAQRSVAISELKSDLRSRSETISRLQFDIAQLRSKRLGLEMEIKAREEITADLNEKVESLEGLLRKRVTSSLGESDGTHRDLAEQAGQLANRDRLIDSRGFKDELERMLDVSEKHNHAKIKDLEKHVATLQHTLARYEQKLTAKSDAINRLLEELAARSRQIGSIGHIEDVIHNIDDRMTERFDGPSTSNRDRISRVLIGSINNQELRFPLFKDRLTIGRTRENDIQLKADYVSRRHAVIVTEGKTTRIIDWGSRNGVYVNSHRIAEHFLRRGDIVTIGTADFRYEERQKRNL